MKPWIAIGLLAATLLPVEAWSQPATAVVRGSTFDPQLAPGEVLLVVKGNGVQVSRPDSASITVMIATSGTDNTTARASNQAVLDKTIHDVVAAGIDRSAIDMIPAATTARMGFVGNEAYADLDEGGPALPGKPVLPRSFATSSLKIRFTDMAKASRVFGRLQEQQDIQVGPIIYTLLDDASARRSAVDQALAKARLDAALYAKAMSMRVDRTIRIADLSGDERSAFATMMAASTGTRPDGSRSDSVLTEAGLEMTVVLKPL